MAETGFIIVLPKPEVEHKSFQNDVVKSHLIKKIS